jgi:glycosyltransferase 2 family protein
VTAEAGRSSFSRVSKIVAGLLVGGTFLYLAFRHVPLAELKSALRSVHWRWLCVAVLVSLVLQVFRAWRWQLELRPLEHVPLPRLWVVTSVAYMTINLLPARMGEIVRPWLLSRRSGVTFTNVVGNLVIEKTLDSVVLVFYILVGLVTTSNLPSWVRNGAGISAVAAALLLALVLVLWCRGEGFVDAWVLHHLPQRAGTRLKRILTSLLDGMRILPNPRLLLAVTAVSLALWSLPVLSSYIMIRAFGFDVPFSAAVIIFIFIGLGTALPNAPGMIGTYQWACILALGLFDVPQADALAYGVVLNAVQLLTLVAQGLVALPFAGIRPRDLIRHES